MSTATKPVTTESTVSPRAHQLLGAMRINLGHLVELEKSDPAGVQQIVLALVSHLRSWKPLSTAAVAPMDTGPVGLVDLPLSHPPDPATEIERPICADGKYRLSWTAGEEGEPGCVVLVVADGDDHAVGVMTREQAETLRSDVARILAVARG